MGFFKDYLFNTLSTYFYDNDTNKNVNGEGLLQRYLQVFGEEIDEEVIPKIEDFINNLDAKNCDENTLKYISDFFGNPPDLFLDDNLYRKLLTFVISIYKIKGTSRSFELFFNLLGYNVIITDEPKNSFFFYDELNLFYDTLQVNYDGGCKLCNKYSITFSSIDNPLEPITQATLNKLVSVIKFVEPINAEIEDLNFSISVTEDVNFCLEQDIKFLTESINKYDIGQNYDVFGLSYDNQEVNTLLTLPFDCNDSLPLEGISIWALEDDFIVSE